MLPNFVIIGAQKSASSFLQTCLSEHPQVFMPQGETSFFESPDYEHSDITELENLFEGRNENRLGIKRPNYIGKPEVPKRIEIHLPNAKLIAVLRNPIDRAISAYHHNINYGFIPPLDVETGMRQLLTKPSFKKKYRRSPEIIEFGFYHKYLIKYDHFFKSNQILILLHEDILLDPLNSVKKIFYFLNIDSAFIPISLNSRPQAVIYNLTRLKFVNHRNKFSYDYNAERTRLFAKKMNLIDKAIAGTLTLIDRMLLSRFLCNEKPKVSIELSKCIYEVYKNDIGALESLIDRDLTAWKPNNASI